MDNMANVGVPVAKAVRIPAGPAPWHAVPRGLAIHVGTTVVLFADVRSGRLLPVTSGDHGLVPGGVCLPAPGDLLAVAALARHSAPVDFTPWGSLEEDVVSRLSLAVVPAQIDATAVAAMGAFVAGLPAAGHGPMTSSPQRRDARTLAVAAVAEDHLACHRYLRELVGAGPGSTPAGDDVIVGVIAAFDRVGTAAGHAAALLRSALPSFLHRTTTTSRHDLSAAIGGEFAERVHTLLDALSDSSRVPRAMQQARAWGASSGLDLAAGVAAGALSAMPLGSAHAPVEQPAVPGSRTGTFTIPATDRRSA